MSAYPPDCPVFEVLSAMGNTPYVKVGDHITCYPLDGEPNYPLEWNVDDSGALACFCPHELRPLTRAAREVLKHVRGGR